MRIVVRVAALAALLAAFYAMAVLFPREHQSILGFIAIAAVAVAELMWGRRDGRAVAFADGLRDWLIIAAVTSVFWWVTQLKVAGAEDVVDRLSDDFLSVVVTAAVLFAPALVGLLLGRDARGA